MEGGFVPNFWLKGDEKKVVEKEVNWLQYLENESKVKNYINKSHNNNNKSLLTAASSTDSISWADDEVEGESTELLLRLWNEIEDAFETGVKSERMSDAVFNEIGQWRRAFKGKESKSKTTEVTKKPERIQSPPSSDKLKLSILPPEETGESKPPPTYVQTWLSTNFSDVEAESHPVDFGNLIVREESAKSNRRIKVPRPISSQYYMMNRVQSTRANNPTGNGGGGDFRRSSALNNHQKNTSNWSRHNNETNKKVVTNINEEEDEDKNSSNGSNNFLNWLLFDQNFDYKH